MSEIVSARLEPHQVEKLDLLVRSTGWTASEVVRKLVDAAVVLPPQVQVVVGVERCRDEAKEGPQCR